MTYTNDELRRYLAMRQQLDEAVRALRPHYGSIRQAAEAMQRARTNYANISKQLQASAAATSRVQRIIHESNRGLFELVDSIRGTKREFGDLARIHESWKQELRSSVDRMAQVQAAAQSSVSSSIRWTAMAERLTLRLDVDHIRSLASREIELLSQPLASFQTLASRFRDAALAVRSIENVIELPAFVIPGASREILTAGYGVATVLPDSEEAHADEAIVAEIRDETSNVPALLRRLDPALEKMYQGSKEALVGGSVDRSRHVLVSLRELWNHLIRMLAPDKMVLSWSCGMGDMVSPNGRPTRRARILYICREINSEPLSSFLVSDTKALLDYMAMLNRVHQADPGLTDQQLNALVLRTDSWVSFVIQLAMNGMDGT
ncbi:MAG: hypothetical protein OXU69_07450 [Gemmatimonadota bacterium]|nr:hypothetical protein [Gemmatimonadota bacterium]MDE2984527.1 hypothetical protein [Gemmatimonadota bacterium]